METEVAVFLFFAKSMNAKPAANDAKTYVGVEQFIKFSINLAPRRQQQ